MYQELLDNYGVMFEGLAEPVFFANYYPMGIKHDAFEDELWDLVHFARGLKQDKETDNEYFAEKHDQYIQELRTLFNTVMAETKGLRRGVVVIPSSTKSLTSHATQLTREVLAKNPKPFQDLTGNFRRKYDKDSFHMGGNRSVGANTDSLEFYPRSLLSSLDVIVVIDDIVTSGSSFKAANKVLRSNGFGGQIVNFAFSRTFNAEAAENALARHRRPGEFSAKRESRKADLSHFRLDGLVLDLDQTLLNDPIRDDSYEAKLWKDSSYDRGRLPYDTFRGIDKLAELHLPFAIVSNRPHNEIAHIVEDSAVFDTLYPELLAGLPLSQTSAGTLRNEAYHSRSFFTQHRPNNLFSFPEETDGKYTIRYYKPSSRGVSQAVSWLKETFYQDLANPRILGVGNTLEDMIAYECAGLESALALWGVPESLRDHARSQWGADYVFDAPEDLARWCRERVIYYDSALYYEDEVKDKKKAIEFYELAISVGDNLSSSLFQLAYLTDGDNPGRAIGLYERAIEEGSIAAINNLALLVQEDDPARAEKLFQQSINEGNAAKAARNLALLVSETDPERAADLLELAAKEGNFESIEEDLDPLLKAGSTKAITLYEEYVVGADKQKANNLANRICSSDPERARELYMKAIAAGDSYYAPRNLALLLGNDHESYLTYLRMAADAGNKDSLLIDLKEMIEAGNEDAIEVYMDLAVSENGTLAHNIAWILADKDPVRAEELYRMAIEAGDEKNATNNLANLIKHERPEEAESLYRRAIEAGDEYYATNNLAVLIAERDPEEAMGLYDRALAAGDNFYAPRNLAKLICADNPDRSIKLFAQSAEAGNLASLASDLEPLIREQNRDAIELYEKFVVSENKTMANNLAELIVSYMPDKAANLYRMAIDAGDEKYATSNLGWLLSERDPEVGKLLIKRAISAGDDKYAVNLLGIVTAREDANAALPIFEQALSAGDISAQINLAHALIPTDPERSIELYTDALSSNDPEAFLGLSFLLRRKDPQRAAELIGKAFASTGLNQGLVFLIRFLRYYDETKALEAGRYFLDQGIKGAANALIALKYDGSYEHENLSLNFGRDSSGDPIEWYVVNNDGNQLLLVSKHIVTNMSYCTDAPDASWKNSAARAWLNSVFLDQSFSEKERSCIVEPSDGRGLVFCISTSEFEELYADSALRRRLRGTNAEKPDAHKWWLRVESTDTLSAPYVLEDDRVSWGLAFLDFGIRPAMYVSL